MELWFVYGLVLAFFILLAPIILLFLNNPVLPTELAEQHSKELSSATAPAATNQEKVAAYGILAAIFMFMFVMTFLLHKGRA